MTPQRDPRATPPVVFDLMPDIRDLWSQLLSGLFRRKWFLVTSTLLILYVVWQWLVPMDPAWLHQLRTVHDLALRDELTDLAGWIGRWGDLAGYNFLFVLGLWYAGRWRRSRYLQRLAVASLLGATLAGLAVNVLRFTTGRPRPSASVPDGFYGPRIRWDYNAFPSGHTATAFGSSLPVLIAAPAIGVPATLFAASVSWARMFRNQHHPSDVAVAFWIAAIFGVPLGFAVRRGRPPRNLGDRDTDPEDVDEDEEPVEMGEARARS